MPNTLLAKGPHFLGGEVCMSMCRIGHPNLECKMRDTMLVRPASGPTVMWQSAIALTHAAESW